MVKNIKAIVVFLAILLLLQVAVSAKPKPQSWERKDWKRFWGEISESFLKNLLEAITNPKLELLLKGYTLYPDVIADGRESEIYIVVNVGNQEKRLPGNNNYWPTEPGKHKDLYTYNKATFTIPPFQDFHYVLVDVWDYDPFNQDDRLDWAVFKYDTASQSARIFDSKEDSAITLNVNFETQRDIE